jgi:hypothetical protein
VRHRGTETRDQDARVDGGADQMLGAARHLFRFVLL